MDQQAVKMSKNLPNNVLKNSKKNKTGSQTEGYRPELVPNILKIIQSKLSPKMEEEKFMEEISEQAQMASPIKNRIGGAFIPVRDIEKAREWYCMILGIPADCEIMSGHLCPLPMEGSGLILDTMPMWGGKDEGGVQTYKTPAFMFSTDDLQASYNFMQGKGVELVTEIEFDHWFAFRDPDGNLLMVCAG